MVEAQPWWCVVCNTDVTASPGRHENQQHDGAQTCWPVTATTGAPVAGELSEDCAWLGCEWDWYPVPCRCGREHVIRICVRCLVPDDSETERCPAGRAAVA